MGFNPENIQPNTRPPKKKQGTKWVKIRKGPEQKEYWVEVLVVLPLKPGEVPKKPPDDSSLTKEKLKPKPKDNNWTTWIAESDPGKDK